MIDYYKDKGQTKLMTEFIESDIAKAAVSSSIVQRDEWFTCRKCGSDLREVGIVERRKVNESLNMWWDKEMNIFIYDFSLEKSADTYSLHYHCKKCDEQIDDYKIKGKI